MAAVVLVGTIAAFGVLRAFHPTAPSAAFSEGTELVDHILATHDRPRLPPRHHAEATRNRPILGYITPWNGHGYDVAKTFRGVFTHIAPVWFQVQRASAATYTVTGEHDVDAGWVADVRKPTSDGRRARVVPRVIVEGMSQEDYIALFSHDEEQRALASRLVHLCQKHAFDGVVLELWSRLAVGPQLRPALHRVVKTLGVALHADGRQLVLVVPPSAESFTPADLAALSKHVDLFSFNTYDYSPPTTAGPNAPYDWVHATLAALRPTAAQRAQLLLGLNFYGTLYGPAGGTPIVASQYLDVLRTHRAEMDVTWNARAREHALRFRAADGHQGTLYYPTQRSIAERVALARELGSGLCIWELGQGLDHFVDVL